MNFDPAEKMELAARIFLFALGSGAAAFWTRQGRTVATLTPNQLLFLLTLTLLAFTL